MHKRKHKHQICARLSFSTKQQCPYCTLDFKDNYRGNLIRQSVLNKYGKSGIDASQSSNYLRFVEGKSQVYKGGYQEFKRYYESVSYIQKYYNFNAISDNITKIIENHCKDNKYQPRSFKGKSCLIMHKYYLHQKGQKIDYKNSQNIRSTETGQMKRYIKCNDKNVLNRQKKKRNKIFTINQSFEQIVGLQKTIDKMCSRFNSQKIITNFQKQLNSKHNLQQKKNSKKKKQLFSEHLQRKISEIRSNQSGSKTKRIKVTVRAHTQTQQIYGLDQYFKQSSSNGKNKGYSKNYRVQTEKPFENFYDSPVSKAYYTKNGVNTQKSSMISKDKTKKLSRSRSKKSSSLSSKIKSFYDTRKRAIQQKTTPSISRNSPQINIKKKLSKSKKKKNS